MNALDESHMELLFALLVQFHRKPHSYSNLDDLYREYSLKFDKGLLRSLPSRWEKMGFVDVSRTLKGSGSARILDSEYANALGAILDWLGATELRVFPAKEEILSDADPKPNTPLLEGWKWLTFEKEVPHEPAVSTQYVHHQHPFPVPPGKVSKSVDWTKWGTIIGGLGLLATILIAVLS